MPRHNSINKDILKELDAYTHSIINGTTKNANLVKL